MNCLTQSLKPRALNSWWIYSNKLSSWLWSSTISIGFCSPTLITTIFKIQGARPCIALSHSFLPLHDPSILPCFVTSILWGGNTFVFRSFASNSMVFFATHCCVLMSPFDLLDGSYSSSLVVCIFSPLVLILPTPNPLTHLPNMEPL